MPVGAGIQNSQGMDPVEENVTGEDRSSAVVEPAVSNNTQGFATANNQSVVAHSVKSESDR